MIAPAIHFNGNCEKAMKLYEKAFNGTDIEINYYDEAPENHGLTILEGMGRQIMHASMTISGTMFNFSDVMDTVDLGDGICFNVFMNSPEEVEEAYNLFKEKGQVVIELGPQFFSQMYGSVIDEFGVKWQLIS